MGKLVSCLSVADPYVEIGGLFTVCTLAGAGGRFAALEEVGGRGGGARLPKVVVVACFCWFKALMRSLREVNCGSSTSAIIDGYCSPILV